ncbi:recombinase family protein [Sphingomonas sp. Leaf4]|uniref:recombinase family protein n=1 Tax=Sphingomonas sp. Leaf4 TaxID=2876553 RepID=UPI003FA6A855
MNYAGQQMNTIVQAARVYLRMSTGEQDLARQDAIIAGAWAAGFYVAAVYREKASGARPDRPGLLFEQAHAGIVRVSRRTQQF